MWVWIIVGAIALPIGGLVISRYYRLFVAGYWDAHEVAARTNRKARGQELIVYDEKTGLPAVAGEEAVRPYQLKYERVKAPQWGSDEIEHGRFKDDVMLLEEKREKLPEVIAIEARLEREVMEALRKHIPKGVELEPYS